MSMVHMHACQWYTCMHVNGTHACMSMVHMICMHVNGTHACMSMVHMICMHVNGTHACMSMVHVHMHVHTCTHACTYMYTCMYIHVHMHACQWYMYVHMHACAYGTYTCQWFGKSFKGHRNDKSSASMKHYPCHTSLSLASLGGSRIHDHTVKSLGQLAGSYITGCS